MLFFAQIEKKTRDYFVNSDYKKQQFKRKQSNQTQYKSGNENIHEFIMLFQDIFFDIFARETLADKSRTSSSSTHKYIWKTLGNIDPTQCEKLCINA